MDLEKYLHGDCHIFAVALHLEFGYQMQLAVDEFDIELKREVLIHAYCIHEGKYIDSRGILEYDNSLEILEEFDYSTPCFKNVSLKDVDSLIKDRFLHGYEIEEIENIRKYLRENKYLYQ